MLIYLLSVFIMLLLHLGTLRGSPYSPIYQDSSCEIESDFDAPYVSMDCRSEIRVITIRLPSVSLMQLQMLTRKIVNLEIRIGNNEKNVIFVLNSMIAISWKIKFKQYSHTPNSTFQFWVSNGSLIRNIKSLRQDSQNVKIFEPLEDVDLLSSWVIENIGVPDTISTYNLNRTIVEQVARDGTDECHRSRDITPVSGCVHQTDLHQNMDTHIIEIIIGNASHYERSTLEDLKSETKHPPIIPIFIERRERKQSDSDVHIILRSNKDVIWKVKTKKVRGSMQIITDRFVDSDGIDMTRVGVVIERLDNLSREELIDWTALRYDSYSYTLIDKMPKHIDIVLDKKKGFEDFKESRNVVETLKASLNLKCVADRLQVTIPNRILTTMGMTSNDIWLSDKSGCDSTEFDKLKWDVAAGSCGVKKHGDMLTAMIYGYDHSVKWNEASKLHSMEGNFEDGKFSFSVTCYTAPFQQFLKQNNYSGVELILYANEQYNSIFMSNPILLTPGKNIYVGAKTTDKNLWVEAKNCDLKDIEDHQNRYKIIHNRCKFDKTTKWIDTFHQSLEPPSGDRFSFEFATSKFRPSNSTLFELECELSFCSQSAAFSAPGLSRCHKKRSRCYPGSDAPILEPLVGMIKSVGQIKINDGTSQSSFISPLLPSPSYIFSQEINTPNIPLPAIHVSTTTEMPVTEVVCPPLQAFDQVSVYEGVSIYTVIGIAFTAFFIGVALVGILWFLHNRSMSKNSSCRSSPILRSGSAGSGEVGAMLGSGESNHGTLTARTCYSSTGHV